MTEYESERKLRLIGDLVSHSRRILSNEIAFLLGIHIISKIISWSMISSYWIFIQMIFMSMKTSWFIIPWSQIV
jgi:hypothetical protein